MRTERQRRERQMLDIAKACDVKTGDIARTRKVAAVTARLKPPVPKVEPRTVANISGLSLQHKLSMVRLKAELDQMIYKSISTQVDDRVDALRYAFTHR